MMVKGIAATSMPKIAAFGVGVSRKPNSIKIHGAADAIALRIAG